MLTLAIAAGLTVPIYVYNTLCMAQLQLLYRTVLPDPCSQLVMLPIGTPL